jgi:iron complex outermembrane receptor protein
VSGSAALFVTGIDDFILIQSGYAKPAGMGQRTATIARNVEASSWGGEATLAWEALAGLKVDGSLAYVRGRNATDDLPLAQLPPLEGRVGVRYARRAWSLGALVRLVGAQDRFALNQGNIAGQDLGPTDAFTVVSLNGGWRVARRLELTAGVDNLLDRTYAEFVARAGAAVAGFTTTTRLDEPGRTLWAKLAVRY